MKKLFIFQNRIMFWESYSGWLQCEDISHVNSRQIYRGTNDNADSNFHTYTMNTWLGPFDVMTVTKTTCYALFIYL